MKNGCFGSHDKDGCHGHLNTFKNLFFSGAFDPLSMKLVIMEHRGYWLFIFYINHVLCLILIYFTARPYLANKAFHGKKSINNGFF